MRSALLLVSALAGSATPASGRPLAAIKETGELRICSVALADFVVVEPPECTHNCTVRGPNFDLCRGLAEFLSKELDARIRPVNNILAHYEQYFVNEHGKTEPEGRYTPKHLESGLCDVYAESFAKVDWRLLKIDIVTHQPGRMMVLVNKTSASRIRQEGDLAGLATIVEKDTVYDTWLRQFNEALPASRQVKIRYAGRNDEKVLALEQGRIDFVVIDVGSALVFTNPARSRFVNLKPAFPVGQTTWGGFGFRKDDKDLQRYAERYIAEKTKDKKNGLNAIFKEHFGVTYDEYLNLITGVR